MSYRIIPRSEWGARYANGFGSRALPTKEVWLHHSVTIAPDLLPPFDDDYEAIRTLERIGQSRFGHGISYTFLITPVGLVFEGHSVDRVGAHTAGRNTISAAICFVGNYEQDEPTEAQLDNAGWLLAHGFLSGWFDAADLNGGHRDLKSTACPGQHAYDRMADIDRRAHEHVQGALALAPPDPAPAPAPAPSNSLEVDVKVHMLWKDGPDHPGETKAVQALLNQKAGQGLIVDGDFGLRTERAVRNWQTFFHLDVDGVVGPVTWATLVGL